MASSPFDILQHQAESAVRSQINQQKSRVRKELSLVTQVRQMYTGADRAMSRALDSVWKGGHEPQQAGELREEDPADTKPVICADGYRRRSPVQRYRRPQDGHLRRKVIRWVVVAVLAVLLVLTIWKGNLLHL